MKLVFYLTGDKNVESNNYSEKDVKRLISQFNNGHLMHVGNAYINPREVIAFLVYGREVTD